VDDLCAFDAADLVSQTSFAEFQRSLLLVQAPSPWSFRALIANFPEVVVKREIRHH
jgi:hypothetical protein